MSSFSVQSKAPFDRDRFVRSASSFPPPLPLCDAVFNHFTNCTDDRIQQCKAKKTFFPVLLTFPRVGHGIEKKIPTLCLVNLSQISPTNHRPLPARDKPTFFHGESESSHPCLVILPPRQLSEEASQVSKALLLRISPLFLFVPTLEGAKEKKEEEEEEEEGFVAKEKEEKKVWPVKKGEEERGEN